MQNLKQKFNALFKIFIANAPSALTQFLTHAKHSAQLLTHALFNTLLYCLIRIAILLDSLLNSFYNRMQGDGAGHSDSVKLKIS